MQLVDRRAVVRRTINAPRVLDALEYNDNDKNERGLGFNS